MMRSPRTTASSMLWVTMKIARVGILWSSQSSRSSPRSVSAVRTSSAENGSSMKSTSGSTTHARLHAAGKLFGVCRFESVKADGVYNAQGALVALDGRHAARFKRRFDILDNRQPRKERETLKHDGHIWSFAAHR